MRKRMIIIIVGIVLLVSAWVGTASAQDIPGYPGPGYPIETETPEPTEEPTEPPTTPDPTQPPVTPEPTQPPATPDPTQPPQPDPTDVPPTLVPTEPSPTPSETPDGCPFPQEHPILLIISEIYDIPYDEVVDMFCNLHMGIGEIVHYLKSLQPYIEGPFHGDLGGPQGHGWGLFWQAYHLTGHPGNHVSQA